MLYCLWGYNSTILVPPAFSRYHDTVLFNFWLNGCCTMGLQMSTFHIHVFKQKLKKILNWREFCGKCSNSCSIYFGSWKLLHINRATRSSFAQSCLTLCDPMNCSTPAFPVHHQLLELAQTHVYRVGEPIQPYHPLSSPSPLGFNLSQHQGLSQWVSYLHQVAKVLVFQHQYFQWIFRTDFF